ncbi:hypothetical protein [Oceanobacillus kapialis]|uniref:hypothetical protein n=1 Tax=Oceanobacillus kapialis TaxID=481353 RepID=UPI00384CFA17
MLNFILFLLFILLIINDNKDKLQELTKFQRVGIAITFLGVLAVVTSCIYYGGHWLAGHFNSTFISYAIFILVVIVSIYGGRVLLNTLIYRISKGVFLGSGK